MFTIEEVPQAASILITADNGYELYLNGSRVGSDVGAASEVWQSVEHYDIKSRLAKGANVIGIRGIDLGGIRGVIAAIRIEFKSGKPIELVTDGTWRVTRDGKGVDYSHPEFVEGKEWTDAKVVGPMGMAPWGQLAWSKGKKGGKPIAPMVELEQPGDNFSWPEGVAFLGDDCSVYVPLRGDAWGVAFRVGDWSRAYTEFDLPCPSKIGRKLYTLKPGPDAKPRILFDAGTGAMGSPSVSFDGQSLLVSLAPEGEKFFHIYRIPVAGGVPQRLTDGPFHDIDPAELPDGRIVFTSTRIGTFEEYHQPPSRALFRMNTDGSDIHPITSTLIFDNEPKVMADGRIAFIRTDNFFDRGKVETHLHVIRPDGTDGLTEIGANVGADYGVRLRAFGYGSPAPMPDGRLAFISNRGNFIASPGGNERDFHKLPGQLGDLAALPDGRLICTVLQPGGKGMSSDVLGIIDPRDNKIVSIFESSEGSIHSPVSLGSRPRPPIIPDYVDRKVADQPGATGFLLCQDARFSTKTKADWERIRAIRVLAAVPLTIRSSHSHIVHAGHETVELGTVPLSPDGSFFVEVPADTPLALQAVDAEGRSELNEMSWIYVRPGERRSCVGCHQPRESTPALVASIDALRTPPLKLVGQGNPHRSRGNNSGVTGMMDLQFERFRECASLNRHSLRAEPLASGRDEIAALRAYLLGGDDALKISAAQRLAIFRTHKVAPALTQCLNSTNREVRVAAALALAPCGTRDSVPALLSVLDKNDALVSQAAVVALENITGHTEPASSAQAKAWQEWFAANSWDSIEQGLIKNLSNTNSSLRSAIIALGHIGGDAGRAALREFIANGAKNSPYAVFEKDNRTDTFTFAADSPLNPRTLQEAVRALGQLRDPEAVPLLRELLAQNIEPKTGNLFFAEAAIEALGRIATPETEAVLIETFAALKDYWHYVGWYSDHPALYACHSSPLHARIIEALDLMASTRAASIVPQLLRSIPTDPDRALFPDNDDYETLVGRLIRRSGRGSEVIETCLAVLGDPESVAHPEFKAAVSTAHAAWAGHPGPENRAAQILSLVCRDPSKEPQVRAAFTRFLARPEEPIERTLGNPKWTPIRHWVLFYLGRTLGQLSDRASLETLTAVLSDDQNEARHGRPDPSEPEIHYLQLDYTPCWRAAAAWALGQIGDNSVVPALLGVVRNMENATDTRHAAAKSLEQIADPSSLSALEKLAADYPEVSTRRVLLSACAIIRENTTPHLARSTDKH
ncbi:MAG: HEAT repeat domain-containing protein [Verrucomicrobia bacterium]|nr:HEAT repeat domain-containing protein [Verrucomicrobiota bacterium]